MLLGGYIKRAAELSTRAATRGAARGAIGRPAVVAIMAYFCYLDYYHSSTFRSGDAPCFLVIVLTLLVCQPTVPWLCTHL
jgi:hypothetical protein